MLPVTHSQQRKIVFIAGNKGIVLSPIGNIKPNTNKKICTFLRLNPLPSASWSILGALKTLRRLPRHLLSWKRCGDQTCEVFGRGSPRTSATITLLSSITGVIVKEFWLRECLFLWWGGRFLGRDKPVKWSSVEIDALVGGRLLLSVNPPCRE